MESERAEVDLLLNSRKFARTNNLGRFLGFVCGKYFEGAASEIKEYSIAVEALGRPPEFDPQVDCVVRVTAHNLRKQLELYYATEGASHSVHVCLPPGHYVPQFVHHSECGSRVPTSHARAGNELDLLSPNAEDVSCATASVHQEHPEKLVGESSSTTASARDRPRTAAVGLVLVSVGVFLALAYFSRRSIPKLNPSSRDGALAASVNLSLPEIHAFVGRDRARYVDRAGLTWESDRFCSGGNSFSVAGHTILGTEDAQLFQSGSRGIFKCSYPVPPGPYEVHLLFAETSGLQEASRNVAFSINGGPTQNLDVLDDAGGNDVATTKIYTDVKPGTDGMIHIDFASPESFVNAIEILPGLSHRMLPVRIIAGQSSYRDAGGTLWLSDRYFFGGRLSHFGGDRSKRPNGGIYEGHRFGHFRYIIPVATAAKYTLKLHFLESWFGVQNGGIGGTGSRIFDVFSTGSLLLKDFDIYREAGSEPLVKTFTHMEPTAQGKIELYFTPVVNYALISAIEVLPE